eukprot:13537989-Heterocapsa_arctica.AAC.1
MVSPPQPSPGQVWPRDVRCRLTLPTASDCSRFEVARRQARPQLEIGGGFVSGARSILDRPLKIGRPMLGLDLEAPK